MFVDAFPRNYEIELDGSAVENPSLATRYFPSGSNEGGKDGTLVVIHPRGGAPYRALFEFGVMGCGLHSAIYSCPNPDSICVVSNGAGYLVPDVAQPQVQELPCIPVVFGSALPSDGLLFFCDYTDACAVGGTGIEWKTPRIASDGINITRIDRGIVEGEAWSAPLGRDVPFNIDLKTGEVTGGLELD